MMAAPSQSDQHKGVSGVRLTICIRPVVIGAVLLWALAVGLMSWDMLDGPAVAEKGRWAILAGIAAATLTVSLVMRHCRRVILEVMSREHMLQILGADEAEQAKIRALR
jgi:hypothetical protein